MTYVVNTNEIYQELLSNGYAFLPDISPQIKKYKVLEKLAGLESNERTFEENNEVQLEFMQQLNLDNFFEELRVLASSTLEQEINERNKYFVCRRINAGNTSEGFRGHYDSHYITIVVPVLIPSGEFLTLGELFVLPKARKHPKNEIQNIFGKAISKRWNDERKYLNLEKNGKGFFVDFQDYRPLVFLGNTTFHGNFPVKNLKQKRITFLYHLFDTSPRFGIGSLLRAIRSR